MVRIAGLINSNTKAALLVSLLAIVFAGGLTIAHQFGVQANSSATTHPATIQVTNHSDTSAEPSSSDEGFINNDSSTDSSSTSSTNTSVIVNGQSIPVPQNGSVSQTITSDGTTTDVNVQSQNSSTVGQAGNSNHSSVNVNVQSHSSSQDKSP